jgi:hypothetical protein
MIEQATTDVTYQGYSLKELLEANRRLHAALEKAARDLKAVQDALQTEKKQRG